jgi:replication-associated recombination protein RarA
LKRKQSWQQLCLLTTNMENEMSFEEKYEPKHFSELVFADPVTKAICDRYATSKPYKPLMLWGPPGTAKTTTARVIVRERFRLAGCDGLFEEFNGADLTSKDFDKLVRVADYLKLHTRRPDPCHQRVR